MKCEVCGSEEIVKEGELFVCKGCGCKYTLEQVKKLADVAGATAETASEKGGEKLDNLYTLARRMVSEGNYTEAATYYAKILLEKPDDWEAYFYNMLGSSIATFSSSYSSAIAKLCGTADTLADLVLKATDDTEKQGEILNEVVSNITSFGMEYFKRASKFCDDFYSFENRKIFAGQAGSLYAAMQEYGDAIEATFDTSVQSIRDSMLAAWKGADKTTVELKKKWPGMQQDAVFSSARDKIKKYDPTYVSSTPSGSTSTGGCYIATCVYGSYDCAEVWTLRRYRDNTLASTRRGRAFIRLYYAISPTIVKLFGKQSLFRRFWKKRLDKKVASLQAQGVESTPYQDKDWK